MNPISKKIAIPISLILCAFAFWWYLDPYPWLGAIMCVVSGTLTYLLLTLKRIGKVHRVYYIALCVIALGSLLTAVFADLGLDGFLQWTSIHEKEYYISGQGEGALYYPCSREVPQVLLGRATFLSEVGMWQTTFPTTLKALLFLLIPYLATVLVFGRVICGWLCPFGGMNEAMVTGKKERWSLNFLKQEKTTATGVKYTDIKSWVRDTKYGVLAAVILLSIFLSFPLLCIYCPVFWLSEFPLFWAIIGLVVIFAILLPFMTKHRWWCQICPVGALFSVLGPISLFRVKIDKTKCNLCMNCVQACRTYAMTADSVTGSGKPNVDCIRCVRCSEVCPESAVDVYLAGTKKKVGRFFIPLAILAMVAWYTWFILIIVGKVTL